MFRNGTLYKHVSTNLKLRIMKKNFIILWTVILFTIGAKGQNLFFVGEKSYPCTESYVLHSNSNKFFINDLNLVFAKDKNSPLIGVRTKTENVQISGKLIIYLDDGTVISLTDSGFFDYVDKITSSVYLLSEEDLDKMKKSNINTIRFTLLDEYGSEGAFGGNFSATNKSKIHFSK